MTVSTIRAVGVVALVVSQACMIPAGGGGSRPDNLPRGVQSKDSPSRLSEGFGPKSVQGKEPPMRLLARDGTSCVVSRKKYESTPIGRSVWCTWTDTNR